MKNLKSIIQAILPNFVLKSYKHYKKHLVRKHLAQQQKKKQIITKETIINDLKAAGITQGDTLLVHCSLSKIGYVEQGPKTVVDALLETIGPTGNLLMPSSPTDGLGKKYLETNPIFDVKNTPSKLGAVSEYFRKLDNVYRSLHPTEPVCAIGPLAKELTKDHFGQLTPYNQYSPFFKITQHHGKILMIGVTLANAGTNLHLLEDAVENFKYPVYDPKIFETRLIDENGNLKTMHTKVHNPKFSARRRCDELIPMFEKEGALKKINIGQANCLLIDAKSMLDIMLKNYYTKGITMYTPDGKRI